MSVLPLSNATHRDLKFQNSAAPYTFARNKVLASLVASELAHALRDMPVVFGLMDNKVAMYALMGLNQVENLFVNAAGAWQGGYIPAVLRAVPFGLAFNGETQTVVIDSESSHFSTTTGTPLFNDEGEPGEFLADMINFLRAYQNNVEATAPALAAIAAADILTPWELKVTAPDGQPRTIAGLFHIDMERLAAVDAATLQALHRTEAFSIIYGHVYSLRNIAVLEKMAREQEPVIPSSVEFNLLNGDYLKF